MYDALTAFQVPEDVTLGKTIPLDHTSYLTEPYGQRDWCDEVAGTVFSATDCNTLYYQSYGGTEFPARLDHVFIRDPSAVVRVKSAGLVMDEPMTFETGTFELSDHYGVETILEIAY